MKKIIFILGCLTLFIGFSSILYNKLTLKGHRDVDSSEYELIGQYYAATGNLYHPEYPNTMPSHTIGYHWFLGIIFSLFYQSNILFIFQILLGILCSFMLYNLALQLFNQNSAYLVLFLFSFNIGFLVYAQLILAEILLATFLVGFLYFFCLFIKQQNKSNLSLAAFLLGCSVIVKPVALYFITPLSCILFFMPSKTKKHKMILFTLMFSCFYFPIINYMAYNKKVFGIFCVTNLVSENIFIYFLPRRILPRLDTITRENIIQKIDSCKNNEAKLELSKNIFFMILRERPFIIFSAWANAMMRTFFGLYSTQLKSMFNPEIQGGSCSFFNMQGNFLERAQKYITFGSTSSYLSLIALCEAIWLLLQYLFVIIALIYLFLQKKYALLSFFCSYIGYFSFITGHDGCGRYRLMFEPILLLLTALGIVIFYQAFIQQKKVSTKENFQFSVH